MGNDDGDRCNGEKQQASDLVIIILREVDTANAFALELRDAVSREDRQRIPVLKAKVNAAWKKAEAAIGNLERLSGRREVVARAALSHSQAMARTVSTELWKLVTGTNEKSDVTKE